MIVNSAVTQITVSGSGFEPASSAPSVRFNGTTLTVSSSSDTSFVASLPSGLSSGSYLLEVENSDTFTNTTQFEVAITVQTPSTTFVGFGTDGIFGAVTNLALTSTAIQIPATGSSISAPGNTQFDGGSVSQFRLILDSALSTSLTGTFKNVTQSTTLGPITISAGNLTNVFGSSMSINPGDQVVLILSSGSAITVPGLQWEVGF